LVVKRGPAGPQPVIEAALVAVPKKESPKAPTEEVKKPVKEEVKAETPQAKPVETAKKPDQDEDWVLSESPAKPVPPEVARKESPKAVAGIL
jgi:hypothetical protein